MEKKPTWISQNLWVISLVIGLLAFVGLALPLLNAKPVTYDPATTSFKPGSRTEFGAGMLFGLQGAVAWPYLLLYSLLLVAHWLLRKENRIVLLDFDVPFPHRWRFVLLV